MLTERDLSSTLFIFILVTMQISTQKAWKATVLEKMTAITTGVTVQCLSCIFLQKQNCPRKCRSDIYWAKMKDFTLRVSSKLPH